MRAWNSSLSVFNLAAMSLRVLTGVDKRLYLILSGIPQTLDIVCWGKEKRYIVYLEYSKKFSEIGGAALTWGACVPPSRLFSIETVLRA